MSEQIELTKHEQHVFNELFQSNTSQSVKLKLIPKADVDALANVFALVKESVHIVETSRSKIETIKRKFAFILILLSLSLAPIVYYLNLGEILGFNYIFGKLSIYYLFISTSVISLMLSVFVWVEFNKTILNFFVPKFRNETDLYLRKRDSCKNLLTLLGEQTQLYQFDMNTKLVMEEHILDLKHVLGIDK